MGYSLTIWWVLECQYIRELTWAGNAGSRLGLGSGQNRHDDRHNFSESAMGFRTAEMHFDRLLSISNEAVGKGIRKACRGRLSACHF